MSAILCSTAIVGSRLRVSVTIATNLSNFTFNTAAVPGYVAGATDVFVTVNSGVYLYSTAITEPGLTMGQNFVAGDNIFLQNNGFILGKGGKGAGDDASVGGDGGVAMKLLFPVTLSGSGTLAGGGGGGGAIRIGSGTPYNWCCGGGGAGGGDGGGTANGATTPGAAGGNGVDNVVVTTGGGGGLNTNFFGPSYGPGIDISGTPGVSSAKGGYGYGGGGSGSVNVYTGSFSGRAAGQGGSGGYGNSTGGNGAVFSVSSNGFTATSGGGGGWGGGGGSAQMFTGGGQVYAVLNPGAGGKAVDLNGKTLTGSCTIVWGAIS